MTINFIMNSIDDAHANKRIKDFEQQGYDVRLFGFDRNLGLKKRKDITIIGKFTNTTRYIKRISIYFKGIKRAFNLAKSEDTIWYYQGLDTALFAFLLDHRRIYIYEECDLVHTEIKNKLIRSIFERIDKYIIKKSYRAILTSEGFLKYHYKRLEKYPENIIILPNKLSKHVEAYKAFPPKSFNPSHIKFAFIGGMRYMSLVQLAKSITNRFPNHEFHFYGFISPNIKEEDLPKAKNVFFHGSFSSPKDLPKIYSEIDIVVATYDISSKNVRYAEPNKLYESIYFRCPIIVSKHTFLEEKVMSEQMGYSVDPYDEEDVTRLVKSIENSYSDIKENISRIDKSSALDEYNIQKMIFSNK